MTTRVAAGEEELGARWTAELDFRALAFDVVAIAFAMAVAFAVARAPIGSGDYGQWLMVSRFFTGEDVPSYRSLTALAPLVPLLLAIIRVPVSDPVLALNVLRVLLVFALVLSFYAAGGSIFRSRAAGLWSAVFPAVLTNQFLEMLAFGGILQLAAIVFLLLSLAAVAVAGRSGRAAGPWWTAAGAGVALSIASHAGSVVVIVPAVGVVALLVLLRAEGYRRWLQWPAQLGMGGLIAAAALAYWALVLLPANRDYANNPASLAYRGPDRLFEGITDSAAELALLSIGVAGLGWGLGRALRTRRISGYVLVGGWAAVTWGFVAATIAGGAATDFPRFAPLMLAPVAVAGGGFAAEVCRTIQRRVAQWQPDLGWIDPTFALVALLMLSFGARELGAFRQHAYGYALADMGALHTVAGWVDRNIEDDQFVLVSSGREAKWIEGLSGESTLFSSPVRYDFRRTGWSRSIAAEAILRSTTALINGEWFVLFTNAASTSTGEVPRDLLIGMNHGGEYLDLLRMPEAEARVLSPAANEGLLASLAALEPQAVERTQTEELLQVETTWAGARPAGSVGWTRQVSLTPGSDAVTIIDEVTSDAALAGMELLLAQTGSLRITGVEFEGTSAVLTFTRAGKTQPSLRLDAVGDGVWLEPAENGVRVIAQGSRIELVLTPLTNGASIADPALLYPPQLAEDWNVAAVVLTQGPATEARVRRMQSLGFREELSIGPYLLLVRDYLGSGGLAPAPAPPAVPPAPTSTPSPTPTETAADPTEADPAETDAADPPTEPPPAATSGPVEEDEVPPVETVEPATPTPTATATEPPTAAPTWTPIVPPATVWPTPTVQTPQPTATPTPEPTATRHPGRGPGGNGPPGRGGRGR